jgi:hypothetical protein
LPIAGKGTYYHPRRDGADDTDTLESLRARGYVFGQSGRLQLSKKVDFAWQKTVLDLYERVDQAIDQAFGYRVFFCYGTLLGAVREGDFIGHDLDFDSAYLSKHTDGVDARRELLDIAFTLVDLGFNVVGKRTCLAITHEDLGDAKVDLFHLFFDEDGAIQFPFGDHCGLPSSASTGVVSC